ncbi:MAG TPA: hypothetical protein VMA53_04510 [Stellaceae bacterium]|nr:hypothetical protein [Stellaceae bacterium]
MDGTASSPRIRARQITDADTAAVSELLERGFSARRSREFWQYVLQRLAGRTVPAPYPRYGYLLESDRRPVGVFLQIFSTVWSGGTPKTRCTVSSVYVDPTFRMYAPFLELQTFKYKDVTVLDATPGPSRYAVVEARGYTRYSNGIFVALPALSRAPAAVPVRVLQAPARPDVPFDEYDDGLLRDHADFGCISLWCVTPEKAYPFVLRPCVLKGALPAAHLVFCRDIGDFVGFARPIGRFLARRLQFTVLIDANARIDGLPGKFFPGKRPRYFRGPHQPRLGDLAYTDIALFGM